MSAKPPQLQNQSPVRTDKTKRNVFLKGLFQQELETFLLLRFEQLLTLCKYTMFKPMKWWIQHFKQHAHAWHSISVIHQFTPCGSCRRVKIMNHNINTQDEVLRIKAYWKWGTSAHTFHQRSKQELWNFRFTWLYYWEHLHFGVNCPFRQDWKTM